MAMRVKPITTWGDSEVQPNLLDQVDGDLSQVSANSVAYDSRGCHAAIAERDARAPSPAS